MNEPTRSTWNYQSSECGLSVSHTSPRLRVSLRSFESLTPRRDSSYKNSHVLVTRWQFRWPRLSASGNPAQAEWKGGRMSDLLEGGCQLDLVANEKKNEMTRWYRNKISQWRPGRHERGTLVALSPDRMPPKQKRAIGEKDDDLSTRSAQHNREERPRQLAPP